MAERALLLFHSANFHPSEAGDCALILDGAALCDVVLCPCSRSEPTPARAAAGGLLGSIERSLHRVRHILTPRRKLDQMGDGASPASLRPATPAVLSAKVSPRWVGNTSHTAARWAAYLQRLASSLLLCSRACVTCPPPATATPMKCCGSCSELWSARASPASRRGEWSWVYSSVPLLRGLRGCPEPGGGRKAHF